jgi:hypothetical protein
MVTFEQFRATRRSGQRSDPKIARIADDCLPDISCDQIHTYEFAGFWGGVLEINGKFFWYWPGRGSPSFETTLEAAEEKVWKHNIGEE